DLVWVWQDPERQGTGTSQGGLTLKPLQVPASTPLARRRQTATAAATDSIVTSTAPTMAPRVDPPGLEPSAGTRPGGDARLATCAPATGGNRAPGTPPASAERAAVWAPRGRAGPPPGVVFLPAPRVGGAAAGAARAP